jgi:hypothetical protein
MDFLQYIIAQIEEKENAYKSRLYINPPSISKICDEEITFQNGIDECYISDNDIIIPLNFTKWNPSQKATLVKVLMHNSLWQLLSTLMPCISYEHTWTFMPTVKKDLIKFIEILKISAGWKPLAYYYVNEIFRKYGTKKKLYHFIFSNSTKSAPGFLMKHGFYVNACNTYLEYIRAITILQKRYVSRRGGSA